MRRRTRAPRAVRRERGQRGRPGTCVHACMRCRVHALRRRLLSPHCGLLQARSAAVLTTCFSATNCRTGGPACPGFRNDTKSPCTAFEESAAFGLERLRRRRQSIAPCSSARTRSWRLSIEERGLEKWVLCAAFAANAVACGQEAAALVPYAHCARRRLSKLLVCPGCVPQRAHWCVK